MSFRYRSALLSLTSLILIYAYYFARVATGNIQDPVGLLLTVVVAVAVVQVVGHAVIAATSTERYGPMDERERGLDRRATAVGYYLMIIGSLAAASTIHFGHGESDIANAILLAIVVAECVRQAVFLALHHRAA